MQIDESFDIDTICLSSGDQFKLLICLECPCDLLINSHSGSLNSHSSPELDPNAKYFPLCDILIAIIFSFKIIS